LTIHNSRFTISSRRLTVLFLTLTALLLLLAGAWRQQQRFLTRGIPATLPGPIAHAGPRLGVNVSLEQYDDAELVANLERIKGMGSHYVKQTFYWQEPFDWTAADRLVTAVTNHNLLLVPLLNGNPADNFAPPADPAHFAAWAGQFAGRYGDHLTYYIIWDEPNLASQWGWRPVNPVEYGALLTAAGRAIRTADAGAVIVLAPLAPTIETGPMNLADPLYLQALYDAGAGTAFDVAAGKPYGFDSDPTDRRVDGHRLNFSRAILLREVMERNGDGGKAIWAGNWGWNSLPPGWTGPPSIWGQVDEQTQAERTAAALERARREWPWHGVLFLENWQANAPPDDPRWGFSVAGRATETTLRQQVVADLAYPGFHLARPDDPAQTYEGGWRFSPEFGADISQASGDSVTLRFWGTDVGLRVRRADYRARLYVTVDGRPANALPHDEHGATLVLTAPDANEDWLSIEPVAGNLEPGPHTLTVAAHMGWDQWALQGFAVGYRPPSSPYRWGLPLLLGLAVVSFLLAIRIGWRADWGPWGRWLEQRYRQLDEQGQLGLTLLVAAVVALAGWLTWGEQAAGIYRRLGDGSQLALTAAAAVLFYVTPAFFVYIAALLALLLLLYLRPAWGLVLIAFTMPFYVPQLTKPIFQYRFSPVEIFTLLTLAAFSAARLTAWVARHRQGPAGGPAAAEFDRLAPVSGRAAFTAVLHPADYAVVAFTLVATISLLFTERLGVALTEWRVVIVEPALFYALLRAIRPTRAEMWTILDAFVLSGLAVALYGLWQYAGGSTVQEVITAEGGLARLRAFYGSPNNVALYLGRIVPLLVAMGLMGSGRRRWLYVAALLPISLAVLLSFSKGSLFLGTPVALLIVIAYWLRQRGRRVWPWLLAIGAMGLVALLVALQMPQLSGRLNPLGATSVFRVHLWRSALNMMLDHPIFGVGLDNFLYAYRGRYIFDAVWKEPDLNHPHNLILDFGSRLGLLGLLAGLWLFWRFWRTARSLPARVSPAWRPVAIGLLGGFGHMLAHGLVDHSFFLVDLAFAFYLMLATAVWLALKQSH
jgi:O-antigen ligase